MTSDSPRIAVVVPTRDRCPSLRRLLDALDRVTPPPGGFAVTVVNDGSTDDTASYLRSRPDIAVLTGGGNGPAKARNVGWRSVNCEIVAFIDDDCLPGSSWLQDLVAVLDGRPDLGGVGGDV